MPLLGCSRECVRLAPGGAEAVAARAPGYYHKAVFPAWMKDRGGCQSVPAARAARCLLSFSSFLEESRNAAACSARGQPKPASASPKLGNPPVGTSKCRVLLPTRAAACIAWKHIHLSFSVYRRRYFSKVSLHSNIQLKHTHSSSAPLASSSTRPTHPLIHSSGAP